MSSDRSDLVVRAHSGSARAEPLSEQALLHVLLGVVVRTTGICLAVVWVLVIPFLALNKVAATAVTLGCTVLMFAVPYLLMRRGRDVAAAGVYLASGVLAGTLVVLFSRVPMGGGAIALQMGVAVFAKVLLGRRALVTVVVLCLAADFVAAFLAETGNQLPVIFQPGPYQTWALVVIAFTLIAYPLDFARRQLRRNLERLGRELDERRQDQEHILYQAQLIDQSADPVMAADNNLIVTYWNPAAERLLGWSRSEAVGRPLDSVTPFSPTGFPRNELRNQLEQAGQFMGEVEMLARDGSVVIVDASISLLRNASGEPIGTVGGLRDMTARRQAEKALRRSEERLRLIADTAPVGILVLNRSGDIAFANRAAGQILGEPLVGHHAGLEGWSVTDFSGNTLERDKWPVWRALKEGHTISAVRMVLNSPDGKRMYVSVSAAPLGLAGGVVEGVVVAVEDLTERRDLEERYLHAQKMEGLGRLAGGLAHDFNNLLTVINGYSQMLLQDKELPVPYRSKLQRIAEAGGAGAGLCQQLLAFGRRQFIESAPIDVNEVVQEVSTILRRTLGENIELRTDLDPQTGAAQLGAGQLHQVVMNLAINARDAMPNGGRLRISTSHTQRVPDGAPADTKPAEYVQLTVSDNGHGMSPETRARAFEPFFTTKPAGKGTGLGLATVFGIVQQNGGWIQLDSAVGQGTQVSVFLPHVQVRQAEAPAESHAVTAGSENVLVVEDQPEVRRFVVESVRAFGYAVMEAASGADALALLERQHIDLVITDMIMPGMSGKDLIEAVESRWPGTAVLILSGYSDEEGPLLNALGHTIPALAKPFSLADLAAAVRRGLDRPRAAANPTLTRAGH